MRPGSDVWDSTRVWRLFGSSEQVFPCTHAVGQHTRPRDLVLARGTSSNQQGYVDGRETARGWFLIR